MMRSNRVGSSSLDMGSILRRAVPQPPVKGDAVLVAVDAVGGEVFVLVSGAEVAVEVGAADREVDPAVADAEAAEVDVPHPATRVVEERVGGTRIAVGDDEVVDRW